MSRHIHKAHIHRVATDREARLLLLQPFVERVGGGPVHVDLAENRELGALAANEGIPQVDVS
jgi:hypothetical protein